MAILGQILDVLIAILAFGLLILIHELGHFLAARWAGIRVLAFAIGFGNALVSYRKGLGWRRGSSEREYAAILKDRGPLAAADISPTEYRLNWLPFGGYVKMLGQVDGDPTQTSNAPDSYQRAPVWKRMVVISAGVVANVLLAAALFLIVFKVGLKTEPAAVGFVAPNSPASRALVVSGDSGGRLGLMPGDRVLSIQGKAPRSFKDIAMGVAMTPRGTPVRLVVERQGQQLTLEVSPEEGAQTRLMEIGIAPPNRATLATGRTPQEDALLRTILADAGVTGLDPGSTLIAAQHADPVAGAAALTLAAQRSAGQPFTVTFRTPAGRDQTHTLTPRAALQNALVPKPGEPGSAQSVTHLLGLAPVLGVAPPADPAVDSQGLKPGDIFARIGAVEYPTLAEGIAEIRKNRGQRVDVTVLRADDTGVQRLVRLDPPPMVRREGLGVIGFTPKDSRDLGTVLARAPMVLPSARDTTPQPTPAVALNLVPGSRILKVDGRPVASFTDLREALKAAADQPSSPAGITVTLTVVPPASSEPLATAQPRDVAWTLAPADLAVLRELAWTSPLSEALFEPEEILLKAAGPIDALAMGLGETHRVMLMTYLTFARLADGTVKVEHLKGPVGIAHIGSHIVDRGLIWLLFFMALVSVNLAVINSLPLPVVDGGQLVFLAVEALRGKPAPIAIQNVATMIGLALIGAMFLIVTFNDIANLFG